MPRIEYHAIAPAERERVWEVLVNPAELAAMTPPRYHLAVEGRQSAVVPGAYVFLQFSFLWRRWSWSSEVKTVRAPELLVEEMHEGPLAAWRHEIRLSGSDWGTEVVECIEYDLPGGLLGKLLDRLLVGRALQALLEFRERALLLLLSRKTPAAQETLPGPSVRSVEEADAENVLPLPPRRERVVSLLV